MKQQVKVEKVDDKWKDISKFYEILSSVDNGSYTLTLESINPLLTKKSCQEAYFSKIDYCVFHTGYKRYEIHEMFKKHAGIASTKDLDVSIWIELLKSFSWWAFNNFDCVV